MDTFLTRKFRLVLSDSLFTGFVIFNQYIAKHKDYACKLDNEAVSQLYKGASLLLERNDKRQCKTAAARAK